MLTARSRRSRVSNAGVAFCAPGGLLTSQLFTFSFYGLDNSRTNKRDLWRGVKEKSPPGSSDNSRPRFCCSHKLRPSLKPRRDEGEVSAAGANGESEGLDPGSIHTAGLCVQALESQISRGHLCKRQLVRLNLLV